MTIRNYPRLNAEEFATACHLLDRRYRQALLGPLRNRWSLSVCTSSSVDSLDLAGFGIFSGGYRTYVRITCPIEVEADPSGLAGALGDFSMASADKTSSDCDSMDQDMVDAEQADLAIVQPPQKKLTDAGYVTYEIHLHQTYQLPCLWFSLDMLTADDGNLSIDTVYRYLVPAQYKMGLGKTNGLGGISIDNNPVTGVPCFFIHPCLVEEAMAGFECDEDLYLPIWIGQTGSPVGLYIPAEMRPRPLDTLPPRRC